MAELLRIVLFTSLAIHIVLRAICVWRLWRGESAPDRLIGLDLMATLVLAILVLMAQIEQSRLYIDVALALAALSFVGTIALAKYIADQQMF